MFFARYINNEKETAELYYDWDKFHSDTFSPYTQFVSLIDFTIHGRDYQSRKESLRDIAVEWSHNNGIDLYASELFEIEDWFYKNGKRYGLLEEFRENAIC